jgi:hypothetical protein
MVRKSIAKAAGKQLSKAVKQLDIFADPGAKFQAPVLYRPNTPSVFRPDPNFTFKGSGSFGYRPNFEIVDEGVLKFGPNVLKGSNNTPLLTDNLYKPKNIIDDIYKDGPKASFDDLDDIAKKINKTKPGNSKVKDILNKDVDELLDKANKKLDVADRFARMKGHQASKTISNVGKTAGKAGKLLGRTLGPVAGLAGVAGSIYDLKNAQTAGEKAEAITDLIGGGLMFVPGIGWVAGSALMLGSGMVGDFVDKLDANKKPSSANEIDYIMNAWKGDKEKYKEHFNKAWLAASPEEQDYIIKMLKANGAVGGKEQTINDIASEIYNINNPNKQGQSAVSTGAVNNQYQNTGNPDGTRVDNITNFVNGLTSGGNVQNGTTNQPGAAQTQQQVPQQFIYETPAAKNEVLDFMEQFARQYPAMQEQDRRRKMQAALLAPVIQNDKFVDAALGQGQVATTAKQLELLNTAANARVSEAQKPLLAQAFAKAGLPAELAYASEEQLKQIVYSLVTNTNKESAKYKADMAAKLGVYKANQQLEGVRIATAAKQGPEKLIQVMGQAGYPMDEIEAMLGKVYGPYWRNMIGTGAPIQFNLGTGVVQGPEEPDFF